jgi:hypothetical protein
MTDRSEPESPATQMFMRPTGEATLRLGPATRKQLEAVLSQTAGGLLVAAIEGAGYEADDRWQLTIERVTLTRRPLAPPEGENGQHRAVPAAPG